MSVQILLRIYSINKRVQSNTILSVFGEDIHFNHICANLQVLGCQVDLVVFEHGLVITSLVCDGLTINFEVGYLDPSVIEA